MSEIMGDQTLTPFSLPKRKASTSALRSNPKKGKIHQASDSKMAAESVEEVQTASAIEDAIPDRKLPVTILSGFLGSGKTTLLRHILQSTHNLKIALVVNDMAEVNIDGAQVARLEKSKSKEIVQMQNGCICCTLRGDFIVELARLAKSGKFDYIVIESSGISEPIQVAESFAFELNKKFLEISDEITVEDRQIIEDIAEKGGLNAIAAIDTMVTVVDAHNFFQELETGSFLKERFAPEDVPEDDQRTISDLFADQLEFANVIIINKLDLVTEDMKRRVIALVRTFNPYAEILEATKAKVDVKKLVNTGKFDFEEAQTNPGWLRSLQEMSKVEVGGKVRLAPMPETLEYGIGSFVYTARKPFDPMKFHSFLKGKFVLFQPEVEDDGSVDGVTDADEEDTDEVIDHQPARSEIRPDDADSSEDSAEEEASSDLQTTSSRTSVSEAAEDRAESREKAQVQQDDRAEIMLSKRKDPLLAGIYRMKGFLWLATRPRVMGALSAAGAILSIHGEQDWCCERIFEGSCVANHAGDRDPAPIKALANVISKASHKTPYLTASTDNSVFAKGGSMQQVLHACYLSSDETDQWNAIVADNSTTDDEKEEQLQDIIEGKFGDVDLHFIYEVCKDLSGPWGDRRQEIVFIGENLRPEALKEKLDGCLLSDEEMEQWESVMLDKKLTADSRARATRLENMLRKVRPENERKRESLMRKLMDAKDEIGRSIEERLNQIWDDSFWAEWLTDNERPEEEHDHAGHHH